MPKEKLSTDEERALTKLENACQSHRKKSRDLVLHCALLHQDQIRTGSVALQKLEQEKINAVLRSGIELGHQKSQAYSLVSQQMNALQNVCLRMQFAVNSASGAYDIILSARAQKPIAEAIFFSLVIAVLPELGVLGRGVKALDQSKMAKLAEFVSNVRVPISAFRVVPPQMLPTQVQKFADFLDRRSKDIVVAARAPISSNAQLDAASIQRMQAFRSKDEMISALYGALEVKLNMVEDMEGILNLFIAWYDDPGVLTKVQEAFKYAGLDDIPYKASARDFELAAEFILYDMLRAYVKSNFVVKAKVGASIDQLPAYYPEENIDGLDEAQRQMIYDRFGSAKIRWHNSSRPPVNSYKDLVKYWGAQFRADMPLGLDERAVNFLKDVDEGARDVAERLKSRK